MTRTSKTAFAIAMCLALLPAVVAAQGPKAFTPGAPGIGDPYFPLDGNGGYDVDNYLLDVQYDPATDMLTGVATITAAATQNLSSFNFDLVGLTVRSVTVDGKAATWTHEDGELTITPATGIRNHTRFVTVIAYDGVPQTIEDAFGESGFIHTDDGALVIGEPHVAATWFPANDHPIDKASFTFVVTVPDGLEVVANGTLEGQVSAGGWTTFEWQATDPMATYLAGMGIGQFEVSAYRHDRIQYWDAIDPDLFADFAAPVSGDQFMYSQQADLSYKRLTRTIAVPAEGADVSFWATRDTEPGWDFFFVEARTAGGDDWTTLPDEHGATSQDTGFVCPFWLELHPFLEHYQTALPDEDPEDELPPTCEPSGTTGDWWAATGSSAGSEQWSIDLSAWAGETVEISLSYASDDVVQLNGVAIDDVVVSTGEGTTSFEEDGDVMDGWTIPGAPEGSPGNDNDWIPATVADLPPTMGEIAQGSLARQDEIISFLQGSFGTYPFNVAGGIIDDAEIGFALENQTRPIYSKFFFTDPVQGDAVIVHELAHQWFGDYLAVEQWQHIWLNEGFATYAEWLWAEAEGFATVQESFDFWYELIPADDPLWTVVIGDPGPDLMFDFAVYIRGAMTLQQLRLAVGDDAFFTILQRWVKEQGGGNVSTPEFIALAEQVSGQQLDELFEVWLFTPEKPVLPGSEQNVGPLSPETRVTPRPLMPGDRFIIERR